MSKDRRRRTIQDQVHDTFGTTGEIPPADRTSRILEAVVAFVLGTGFWRLVVSDSWGASVIFGVLLAALLFSYGLFRARMAERATERGDDPPRRRRNG